jgi:hypothetical protein
MGNVNREVLDQVDTLNMLLSQTQAVIHTLSIDDNFDCLNRDTIANSLSLIDDQLCRIKESHDSLYELVKVSD